MVNCMKKILFMILILFMVTGYAMPTYAYTEEEKAQAKAWLSAHGYSPDMAGASQAYQDYLDGKFDEELGITENIEEKSIDGEEQLIEETTTEEEHPEKRQMPGIKVDRTDGSVEASKTSDDLEASVQEEGKKEDVLVERGEQTSDVDKELQEHKNGVANGAITTENLTMQFAPLKKDKNKSAVIVLGLSVMAMIMIGNLISFINKKR